MNSTVCFGLIIIIGIIIAYNYYSSEQLNRRVEKRNKITSTCPKCGGTEFTIESIILNKKEGHTENHYDSIYDMHFRYKYDETEIEEYRKCKRCQIRFAKRNLTHRYCYDCVQINKYGSPTPAPLPFNNSSNMDSYIPWELL